MSKCYALFASSGEWCLYLRTGSNTSQWGDSSCLLLAPENGA